MTRTLTTLLLLVLLYPTYPLVACPTQAPTNLKPANESVITSPVLFEWTVVQYTEGYLLYVYDDITGEDVFEQSLTQTSLSVALPPGNYGWSVETDATDCTALPSEEWSFIVPAENCPQPSELLSPAEDSSQSSPVHFEWSGLAGVSEYDFYLYRGDDLIREETLMTTSIDLALEPGSYDWGVDVTVPGCGLLESSSYFTVAAETCPNQAPVNVRPANDAVVTSPVVFEWNAVPDTEGYALYVYDDVTGEDVFEQQLAGTTLTVTLPPGNYGWVVDTETTGCEPLTSEDWYFVVPLEECPEPPELVAPALESTQSSPVHFEWTALSGVSQYYFYLFRNGELIREETLSTTSIDLELDSGTYDWGVDVDLPGCGLLESYSYFFIPGGECPEEGPKIESPELFAEVSSPVEFRWEPIDGVSEYYFYLESDTGEVLADQLVSTTSLTFDLTPEEYYWSVDAEVPGCPFTYSEGVFRVTCGRGSPELLVPADETVLTTPVEFSWTAVDDVEGYYLVVLLYDEFYIEEFVEETSAEVELPGGEFEWFVEAVYEEGCPPESSEGRRFTIAGGEDCPTTGSQLLTPEAGATITSTPIEFSWTPAEGAFEYWIAVAEGGDKFEVVDFTDRTSSLVALGPGEYQWKVVALFEGCVPVESAIGSFTFPGDPTCVPETLELTSPADDAILTGQVDFQWNAVPDAVEYIVFLESLDGYPAPVATTTDTSVRLNSLASGEYFWWVLAILPDCAPAESDYRYFEVPFNEACDHELPYLLSPPEGASSVPSKVTFEWAAVPEATGYQVWVSSDGSDFAPMGVVVAEPRLTATVTTGRIEWFVEALFAGCPSESSESGTFFGVEDQTDCGITNRPELTVVGSVQSGQNYALYWTPVPGAESYEVQESKDQRFLSSRSVGTPMTSSTFTATTSETTVRHYRVRAVDRCGEPGPYSSPSAVVIEPPGLANANRFSLVTGVSSLDPVRQPLFIPGSGSASSILARASSNRGRPVRRPVVDSTFTVTSDVPWLRAKPSSGNLPPAGVTISIEADPSRLPAGTFAGSVNVSTTAAGKVASDGSTLPVSVSIVTPVGSGTTESIPPDTLVIPVVRGGTAGRSNVEISNLSPVKRNWEIQFVPAGTDGFRRARKTIVQLDPGSTIALDNLMQTWFGFAPGTDVEGALSIRPLDTGASTVGSGATFIASSLFSTLGDRSTLSSIPAIRFGNFLSSGAGGKGGLVIPDIRSANGTSTAFSIVEGSGNPATALVRIIGSGNQVLAESTITLQPFESRRLENVLDGAAAENARAEVTMTSGNGRLSAVGLIRDGRSGDERVVRPVVTTGEPPERIILGAVSGTVSQARRRVTSLWLYNSTESPASVVLRFIPEDGSPSAEGTVSLTGGESKRIEDVASVLPIGGRRGIIRLSGAAGVIAEASLSVSGAGGELSTSLPIITAEQATRLEGRSLQILQLEASDTRSSSLGLAELAGAEATVEISAVVPGAKVSPTSRITLGAGEIRTIDSILQNLGISGSVRARLIVRVREGAGQVAAWGAITNRSTFETTVLEAQ